MTIRWATTKTIFMNMKVMKIDFTVILHDRKQRQNRTNDAFCLIIKGIFSTFLFPLFFFCRFQTRILYQQTFFSFDNFFLFLIELYLSARICSKTRLILDMSADSVGLLSSPERSSSPSLTDQIVNDFIPIISTTTTTTTSQINNDQTNSLLRSPGKRQLTLEESQTTSNDTKRLCNR